MTWNTWNENLHAWTNEDFQPLYASPIGTPTSIHTSSSALFNPDDVASFNIFEDQNVFITHCRVVDGDTRPYDLDLEHNMFPLFWYIIIFLM
jgi:hypothetical protein